ncbi:MAG: glycosyltransferase family 4 protein [Thermoanaerobaculia bacterium]|nr:glycosyltransferase family 4 protein [Thermoanaerobaculia bacterium]
MKVLFVYKYLTFGGCETVLKTRIEGLRRRGHDARAWFFQDFGGRPLFDELGDAVFVGDAEAFRAAWGFQGWDLVSTLDSEEVFEGLAGEALRPPLAVECHTSYPAALGYLGSLRREDVVAIAVPSVHQAALVRGLLPFEAPVHVLPNPIHGIFLGEPGEFRPRPGRPLVSWIGRLDAHKNWSGFLEIGESLLKRRADPEFWIVAEPGEGSIAQRLFAQARDRGLLSRLRWFRGVPHERVPAFLDATRASGGVVVCTSKAESFGMAVVEAMARGCVVVAPKRGPFTEFVTHGDTGLLFEEDGGDDAASLIHDALADEDLMTRLGLAARRTVLERFTPEKCVDAVESFLSACVARS